MPKKKNLGAEDITEKEILSLYEGVLPMLYQDPKEIGPIRKLRDLLRQFVSFDFLSYLLDSPQEETHGDKMSMKEFNWPTANSQKMVTQVSIGPATNSDPAKLFEENVEGSIREMIERRKEDYPDEPHNYISHTLMSGIRPRVALTLFRVYDQKNDSAFQANERKILKKLSPHIFLLLRTATSPLFQTNSFQYFDAFSSICSRVVSEHVLSDTEARLLPEILFGYSNQEIAERNFISVDTVKSHIKHILKKTNTKNRIDFISKFFTSPDRVVR
ncbi:MAG: helix-turn-helix transcriptional regulator [Ignavibacteriota bacterium]